MIKKLQKENTPLITTERLILRKFNENDSEDFFLIYGDKRANRFLPWFPLTSITEAKEYLHDNILSDYNKKIAYRYAIALKTDDRPIGYVNVSNLGQSNDFGVNRLREANFPYLTATHDITNPYSGEVMKKIGMTYRYTYEELVQPKNYMVTFRMYQLNLDGVERLYTEYQKKYPYFIEQIPTI